MTIIIGADPWGLNVKNAVKAALEKRDVEIIDIGSFEGKNKDYFDVSKQVAQAIISKKADKGIVFCGTGMGVAIVANKFKGIYAAVVESEYAAHRCKQLNNTNVLAIGGMLVSEFMAVEAVNRWLDTTHTDGLDDDMAAFTNHAIKEIEKIENENFK
jgi:ribose 5-phosphate isomerase B